MWPPSANAALPFHSRFQNSCFPLAHFVSSPFAPSPPPHASRYFSIPPASSFPLTPSGFFNGMLGVSKPVALYFYTFFGLFCLSLFVSRNLTSTYLPRPGSLDSLLCDLIAPTPGLVLFLLMPHTLTAVSSLLSSRAYSSRNFLPPLFLCLTPTLIK